MEQGDRTPTHLEGLPIESDLKGDKDQKTQQLAISAEEALRTSRRWLQALLDSTNESALLIEPDGTILVANETTAIRLGVDLEDLVGFNGYDFLSPDVAESRRRHVEKVVRSGMPTRFEDERNGEIIASCVYPIFGEPGRVTHLAIFGADVTEQKKTERALTATAERFRRIIETSHAGYFFIDKDGIIEYVNDAWLKMYKFSSLDEVFGEHFSAIQVPEHVELAKEYVEGIIRGDEKYLTGEFSRRCKDGSIGYHSFSAQPVEMDGETIGIEGFIIDTTERKHAEEALRESEERLRDAQKIGRIGSWGFAVERKKILWSEQMFCLFERDRILGPPSYEENLGYYQEEESALLEEYFRRAIEEGQSLEVDHNVKLPSGGSAYLASTIHPVRSEEGRVVRLVGTVQDITERKLAEIERERLISELKEAIGKIRTMSGLLPICAQCKRIRDEEGNWHQVEAYVRDRSQAEFTHGLCPECKEQILSSLPGRS